MKGFTSALVAVIVAVVGIVVLVIDNGGGVNAQSVSGVHTGVVTGIETDAQGGLASFSIVNSSGEVLMIMVSDNSPNTEYGLENSAGDRWVADHASSAVDAVSRIRDQQRRLSKITVSVNGDGFAESVVQSESSDLSSNLGYLFAALAITWIGLVLYIVYIGQRQRMLSAELSKTITRSEDSEK